MLTQDLERQYVDKQKLAEFWRTNPDFAGNDCRILEVKDDAIIIEVPRLMTQSEIKSVRYDKA